MAIQTALEPYIARLRTEYARTSIPTFFAWWGENLRACLPRRWQEALRDHTETILVSDSDAAISVRLAQRENRDDKELAHIQRSLSEDEQRIAWHAAIASVDAPAKRVVLCLARSQVLLRHLKLPAAAEHRLAQVLGFEMDRQTPFKLDQVYVDHRVSARDTASRTLAVDMAVVPKTVLDKALAQLQPLAIGLDAVDGRSGEVGSSRLGFNLLPPARRVARRNLRLRLHLALAAVAVLLLVVAMKLWVDNRAQALQTMPQQTELAQKQAKQVAALRKGLSDSLKAATFLSRKKAAAPSVVLLLRDLTHALPDDSFLQRISVNNDDRITLQGQSDHAASLIKELGDVPGVHDPSLSGTLQPDARTHKDRFNVTATLVSQSEGPQHASSSAAK